MKTLSSLFVRAVLLAHAALLSTGAQAQSCGSRLAGDVTLTGDLHCDTSYFAFEITGGGAITISLNGHTLSGTRALQGIGLYSATDVTIKGPGTIKGFWSGINGGQAHGLTVVDVQFEDLGFGISLNNTERTYVANNRFNATGTAIWLRQGSSDPAAGLHTITGNEFSDNRVGVSLCGYDTGNSSIYRNKFLRTSETAIHLNNGTHHNEVADNQIYETGSAGIRLSGSSSN